MKKPTEKERLLKQAYLKKINSIKLPFFIVNKLNFKNCFIPFGLEYKKILENKYLCIQLIIFNLTFNLSFKTK